MVGTPVSLLRHHIWRPCGSAVWWSALVCTCRPSFVGLGHPFLLLAGLDLKLILIWLARRPGTGMTCRGALFSDRRRTGQGSFDGLAVLCFAMWNFSWVQNFVVRVPRLPILIRSTLCLWMRHLISRWFIFPLCVPGVMKSTLSTLLLTFVNVVNFLNTLPLLKFLGWWDLFAPLDAWDLRWPLRFVDALALGVPSLGPWTMHNLIFWSVLRWITRWKNVTLLGVRKLRAVCIEVL